MKIAIIRGPDLNKFEMQNYEPLVNEHDITAYTTYNHNFEIDKINIPIKKLHCPEEFTKHIPFRFCINGIFYKIGYNVHMFGLEKELKNKDIAHVAETYNGYSYQATKAKEKYGTKVVATIWENIPFLKIRIMKYRNSEELRNKVRKNVDAFVAITKRAKEALMLEGVEEERIHIIPAGVDLNRFKPGQKDETLLDKLELTNDDFVLLFVGHLTWRKGVYDLIYAAKMVLSDPELNRCAIKFLFVGSGDEKENILKMAQTLKIAKNVKLVDSFPYLEVHRLYNLADVFILPSIPTKGWQEQFGMVLVEAMASGSAVISTLSGSIPEVVGDSGALIQPNDPLSLYQEIKKLLIDKKLREDLGKKARKRAEKEFNSMLIAEKIDNVYRELEGAS